MHVLYPTLKMIYRYYLLFFLQKVFKLVKHISNHHLFAMHEELLTDTHLIWQLNRLNKDQTIAAIELLQQRLSLMESDDYYLSLSLTALPIPAGIQHHMQSYKITTVRDLLLRQPEELSVIRGVGKKNLERLQKLVIALKEKKDQLKDLTAEELYTAVDEAIRKNEQ